MGRRLKQAAGGPKLDRQGANTITFGCSLAPNGVSAPSVTHGRRSATSITRTALGTYQVVLPDTGDLRNASISVRQNSVDNVQVKLGNFNQTTNTLTFYTYQDIGRVGLANARWREIVSNDFTNIVANGGILSSDTTPTYLRANGATDISTRLTWAAANVDELQYEELDLDELGIPEGVDIIFNARGLMSGGTDVNCGLTVKTAYGFGDTVITDTTTKFTSTVSVVTATIAAADIAVVGSQRKMYLAIVPDAHGTDSLTIRSMFLTYSKGLVDLPAAATTQVMITADMYQRRDV